MENGTFQLPKHANSSLKKGLAISMLHKMEWNSTGENKEMMANLLFDSFCL